MPPLEQPEAPAPSEQPVVTDEGGGGAPEGGGQPVADFESKYAKQVDLNRRLQREHLKLQNQLKEAQGKIEPLSELESLIKEDPLKALEKGGHSYDSITKAVLQNTEATPEEVERMTLKQKVEALEQEREAEKQRATEAQEQAQRASALKDLQEAMESREDLAYSATIGYNQVLLQRLEKEHRETGEPPDHERQTELAMELENEAREAVHQQVGVLIKKSPQFREEIQRLLSGLEEQPSEESPDQSQQVETRTRKGARSKTITRAQQSSVGSREPKRPESYEERKARVLAKYAS